MALAGPRDILIMADQGDEARQFFTLDVSGKDSTHSLKPRLGKSGFALNTRRVFATTYTAGFAANREESLPIPPGDRTA